MPTLLLKPTNQPVIRYYDQLQKMTDLFGIDSEGAISPYFAFLLRICAAQFKFTLVEKFAYKHQGHTLFFDGALLDEFSLRHGCWEAKDSNDDLEKEIQKKFEAGYPKDNILFQSPTRAILYQDGQPIMDADLTNANQLVDVLKLFFEYQPPAYHQWEQAVEEFKIKVPELGGSLLKLIEQERKDNKAFIQSFESFSQLVRDSINPNIATPAVDEMLIQHILTERIFRTIFNNTDFTNRNVIAREIEKVIQALTSRSFSRSEFLKSLDRFYVAIEITAATIQDYSEKQSFLNTVYEKFFQGYSVKAADIYGIVYTPQSVVNFMVNSVEHILQTEFGRSLSDENVHIIDPFVGTGNFIINIMRKMQKSKLAYKYANELHCNEVMLLPYYIASMNIEHTYFELSGEYKPFEGICLVDTFDISEQMTIFSHENTERILKQRNSPIFVVIANPPYNAGQVNENDNNKNRKYPILDKRVSDTYAKASKAQLVRKLNDPYIKAIRWATDRIGEEGIVVYVNNNSFLSEKSFDGMRKFLNQDFDKMYILDLGGNVRKNPKLSGSKNNVFGIQVGVSINIFIKRKPAANKNCEVFYYRMGEFWTKEERYEFLYKNESIRNIEFQKTNFDNKFDILVEGQKKLQQKGITLSQKKSGLHQEQIFLSYSPGVNTARDSYVYNFSKLGLQTTINRFIDLYNLEVDRFQAKGNTKDIDNFVGSLGEVKWSSKLKLNLARGRKVEYLDNCIINSSYRPFTKSYLYFDKVLIERPSSFQQYFPKFSGNENWVICINQSSEKEFGCLITDLVPNFVYVGGFGSATECFPFYTYTEGGSQRRENISDWALAEFRNHYNDPAITKWDIFYYVYGYLHSPGYRSKYAANLRRELPRIPFAPDFWAFSRAGKTLADLHINYEEQTEYPLEMVETPGKPLDWRVKKMRLSPDKTEIKYNEFLTLRGVPKETFDYRLGNRSALDWIIDQYQIKIDKRSGITNDPNNSDDPQYIVHLIGKIITVSLETRKILNGLPVFE